MKFNTGRNTNNITHNGKMEGSRDVLNQIDEEAEEPWASDTNVEMGVGRHTPKGDGRPTRAWDEEGWASDSTTR